MPSVIAHSAASIALAHVFPPRERARRIEDTAVRPPDSRHVLGGMLQSAWLLAVVLGNLPDLDFIPQVITGMRFHHGASHSIAFALAVGAGVALLAGLFGAARPLRLGIFALSAYGLHIAMDMLSTGGPGVQLLWPFSAQYVKFPLTFFPPVNYNDGLWHVSHLDFILFELGFALALAAAFGLWKLWRRRRKGDPGGIGI